MEIVKLIGSDVLPDDQKLIIETARVIRVGFTPAKCIPCRRYLRTTGETKANDACHFAPL